MAIEISGVVQQFQDSRASADPIPDARIRLVSAEGNEEIAAGLSDRDGRFAIRLGQAGLAPPVRLRIVATKEGFLSWITGFREIDVASIPFRRSDVRLVLHSRGELRGRVVETHGLSPVVGAKVEVLEENWDSGPRTFVPRREVFATTDAQGWFTIEMPADPIFMSFQVSAPERLSVLFRTRPLRPPPDGIYLVRLARESEAPRITGTVRDAEGRPVEAAVLRIALPEPVPGTSSSLAEALDGHFQWLSATKPLEDPIRTDADGRYSAVLWPLGRREVTAAKEAVGETRTVEILAPREHVLDFRLAGRPVTFVGTIRARATGLPIPTVQVTPIANWPPWLEKIGCAVAADGTIRCGPLPRVAVLFDVRAVGFGRRTLEVVPDETATEIPFFVELDLEAKLVGRVVDQAGVGIYRAQVYLEAASAPVRIVSSAQTEEDGSFVLGGLPAGEKLLLGPSALDMEPQAREVTLDRPGEVRDVGTIVLVRKGN